LAWQLFHIYSNYYRNKLYKFQREIQKLGGTTSVFVPPGKFSLEGPDHEPYFA